MKRHDNRAPDQIRPVSFETDCQIHPDGSVLAVMGNTKVICSVFVLDEVPRWMPDASSGWATCEYDMLPGSTPGRNPRDSVKGRINSRSSEIKRLIGRSVRAVLDLSKIPGHTLWIDCDVLQADGGTRTASINGSYVALQRALKKLLSQGKISKNPLTDSLSAVSVGICQNEVLLDLDYAEDSQAQTDMNIVMCGSGGIVEIQATAEKRPFSRSELTCALDLAQQGIDIIKKEQERAIYENPGRNQ